MNVEPVKLSTNSALHIISPHGVRERVRRHCEPLRYGKSGDGAGTQARTLAANDRLIIGLVGVERNDLFQLRRDDRPLSTISVPRTPRNNDVTVTSVTPVQQDPCSVLRNGKGPT